MSASRKTPLSSSSVVVTHFLAVLATLNNQGSSICNTYMVKTGDSEGEFPSLLSEGRQKIIHLIFLCPTNAPQKGALQP